MRVKNIPEEVTLTNVTVMKKRGTGNRTPTFPKAIVVAWSWGKKEMRVVVGRKNKHGDEKVHHFSGNTRVKLSKSDKMGLKLLNSRKIRQS